MTGHTVKAFEEQLQGLSRAIASMARLAETQLDAAIESAANGEEGVVERIVARDAELDALEREVSREALQLLALRAPVADDLREVLAAIRIAADLERIGDLAKNIAKRGAVVRRSPRMEVSRRFDSMAAIVSQQLLHVAEAYAERDPELALGVWRRDVEVDDWLERLFRELLTYMMEDPRTITACSHLLFMAKNLERAGDHCTRVAETIYSLVTGKELTEDRPKGADARLAVVEPPVKEST